MFRIKSFLTNRSNLPTLFFVLILGFCLAFIVLQTFWRANAFDKLYSYVPPTSQLRILNFDISNSQTDQEDYLLPGSSRIFPTTFIDSYMWIRNAQHMVKNHIWRLPHFTNENTPFHYECHWSSLFAWWLIFLGFISHLFTGNSLNYSIEYMAVFASPILLILLLIPSALFVYKRFGGWIASAFSIFLISSYPLFESFMVANADHHGLINASIVGMLFCLTAGGAGWTSEKSPVLPTYRKAQYCFIASAVLGAIGIWISAVSLSIVLFSIGLASISSVFFFGRKDSPDIFYHPQLWRIWGVTGSTLTLLLYLLEYFPNFSMRLEVIHPLYSFAWLGGAEILCQLSTLITSRKLPTGFKNNLFLGISVISVLLLPSLILVGGPSFYIPSDPFLKKLHMFVYELQTFFYLLSQITNPFQLLRLINIYPCLILFPIPILLSKKISSPLKGLTFFALIPSLLLLILFLAYIRWCSVWMAALIALMTTSLAVILHTPSFRHPLRICIPLLMILPILIFPYQELRTSYKMQKKLHADRDLAGLLVMRDAAHMIRKTYSGTPRILSSPANSTPLSYFTKGQPVGTLYWENIQGLKTACDIFTAKDIETAHQLILQNHITHIVLFSQRNFLLEFFQIKYQYIAPQLAERSFPVELLRHPETSLPWLKRIPYSIPFPEILPLNFVLQIYEVVPNA